MDLTEARHVLLNTARINDGGYVADCRDLVLAELDAARAEIARLRERFVVPLLGEVDDARMTHEQSLFQRDVYQQTAERYRAELDVTRAEIEQLRAHLAAARRRKEADRARVAELEGELAAAESTIAALEDPELRAALSEPTTGDFGPVPHPDPIDHEAVPAVIDDGGADQR